MTNRLGSDIPLPNGDIPEINQPISGNCKILVSTSTLDVASLNRILIIRIVYNLVEYLRIMSYPVNKSFVSSPPG
jgi:hypothetical protein